MEIETNFMCWFIENENKHLLNITKLHVASEAWTAGFKAAQQLLAPDSLKAGEFCLPEFEKVENALPAENG